MPVPFEALLPYGIMLAMFGLTGAGMSFIVKADNGGKPQRYAIQRWDEEMMKRDRRLTGYLRGQRDGGGQPGGVNAPAGFELNNPWGVERR